MPVLIITPDINAETWLGAAGCASGNQTCNGMKPALVPNPITASRNKTPANPWVWMPCAAQTVKSIEPVSRPSNRKRQQKRRAQMGGDKVNPTCLAHGLAFMLKRHQKE